jgi:NAD(P) transhydrogenase subunit alpha
MDIALIVVFVIATFLGAEVIAKVPAILHTPLMSGTNAISGITILGSLVIAGSVQAPWGKWLGFAAVVFAMINVVGGFLVTDRMLAMFKRKEPAQKAPAKLAAPSTDGHG